MAKAKPTMTGDVVLSIIGSPQEPERNPTTATPEGIEVPKGWKLLRESKTERLQLLIRLTTKNDMRRVAAEQGRTLNDLVNEILENYVKDYDAKNGRQE